MAQLTIRPRPGTQRVDEAAVARIARSPRMRRDMRRRADHVAAYVRLNIPMRTGRLRSSVRIEEARTSRTDHSIAVLMGRGVPYAPYFIYGTRPHEITPRRKKVLAWRGAGGAMVFRRRVLHPGNDAIGVRILKDASKYWRD